MENDYRELLQTDNNLKDMMDFRSKLPVYEHRRQILQLIGDRPVIIVRGKYFIKIQIIQSTTTKKSMKILIQVILDVVKQHKSLNIF